MVRSAAYKSAMFEPLRVDLSLVGLGGRSPGGSVRAAIDHATRLGFQGVRIDGTRPGVRARELDRSARRDLAATIRRAGLVFGGLDLFLPPAHLGPGHLQDRAATAVEHAIGLAGDLAPLGGDDRARVVSLELPRDADDVITRLAERAARAGVILCDHAWPPRDADPDGLAVGLDPSVVLLAGDSPAKGAARLGARLASARLSDADGAGRCGVGARGARLELPAYAASLAIAGVCAVAVDPRGLPDPIAGARTAREAWRAASALPGA